MQQKLKEMMLLLKPTEKGHGKHKADDLVLVLSLLGFDFLGAHQDLLEGVKFAVVKEGIFHEDDLIGYLCKNHALKWSNTQSLKEAFKQFDFDNDGKISVEEFQYFMKNFGTTDNDAYMSDKRLDDLLEVCKIDPNATLIDIDKAVSAITTGWPTTI
ncbi:hypothetical protein FGO68_gene15099 [Halteria grandinella]|uniref:EF-hand domain-containing protein n=1 Tax=Halteria grandinella TaxID=5974 RepID=A0A8J8NFJ1_HALGN|nr:hypothetical protein FGO68_gene15099 [Halteria grandinella]